MGCGLWATVMLDVGCGLCTTVEFERYLPVSTGPTVNQFCSPNQILSSNIEVGDDQKGVQ